MAAKPEGMGGKRGAATKQPKSKAAKKTAKKR
jgi:hypothetical protein